jgi:hypothetical protein
VVGTDRAIIISIVVRDGGVVTVRGTGRDGAVEITVTERHIAGGIVVEIGIAIVVQVGDAVRDT